jgi:LytS/YehU family sensor histidine kinase
MFQIPIHILVICLNLFFLIPKFLGNGKLVVYSGLLLVVLLLASGGIVAGYYFTAFFSHLTIDQLYGPGRCAWYFFGSALSALFAGVIITTSIQLTVVRLRNKRRQQQLEKDQLETELDFLKQQFNPHFLFNTINSIFFLIHKKPDAAAESLARFSDLLRYQLYECNDARIPLNKEVEYVKNCIGLERLRQNDNVRVSCELDAGAQQLYTGSHQQLYIAPFILMPFIENAFKHVSREPGSSNWIDIRLGICQGRLDLRVSNSVPVEKGEKSPTEGGKHRAGGIGLKNVRRRLDLLYPDRHRLAIRRDAVSFEVHLELELLPVAANLSILLRNQMLPPLV